MIHLFLVMCQKWIGQSFCKFVLINIYAKHGRRGFSDRSFSTHGFLVSKFLDRTVYSVPLHESSLWRGSGAEKWRLLELLFGTSLESRILRLSRRRCFATCSEIIWICAWFANFGFIKIFTVFQVWVGSIKVEQSLEQGLLLLDFRVVNELCVRV